jgi:hypothetical protein
MAKQRSLISTLEETLNQIAFAAIAAVSILGLAACESQADKSTETKADALESQACGHAQRGR